MAIRNSRSRRGLLTAAICLITASLCVYLAAHPQQTFLPANLLNPFRDKGPERAALEIISAARRGECNGGIWSTLYLLPDGRLEAYYTVSRRAELCKDFASVEMELVDYVYDPPKAYVLFSSRGLKPVLGKSSPMIGIKLERVENQWKINEFFLNELGFK